MLFAVDLYRSGPVSRLTNSKSGKPVPAARPADFLNRWLLRSAQSRSLLPKLPAKVMRKETRRSIAGGYFPLLNFLHDAAKPFMTEQRKAHRVEFEMGFPPTSWLLMVLGGGRAQWCRIPVPEFQSVGSVEGLAMKEFFLLLSAVGKRIDATNSSG